MRANPPNPTSRRVLLPFLPFLAFLALATPGSAQGTDCDYLDEIISDISAVSLEDPGQPAEVDVTGNDFPTYLRNLDLAGFFGTVIADRRVLDVGAGWSDFVDVLADRYQVEAYAIDLAYGIDVSQLSPECRRLFHRRRLAMDAHRIQFPSNFFDLVVSHELLEVFFSFDPEEERDRRAVRQRIQRGMDIVAEMVRVVGPTGEIRVTDFPDPGSARYREEHPDLASMYQEAFETLMRPTSCPIEISFPPEDREGVTVIRKLKRCPEVDARSTVRVISRGVQGKTPSH